MSDSSMPTAKQVELTLLMAQAFSKIPKPQQDNATMYIKGVIAGVELAATKTA